MKFKYKALIGFIGITIFLIAVQSAMQFMSSYRFVGFEAKQGSWQSLYSEAKADYLTCDQQLEAFKKLRDENNEDVFK